MVERKTNGNLTMTTRQELRSRVTTRIVGLGLVTMLLTLSMFHLSQGTQPISLEVLLSILSSPSSNSSLGTATDELIVWSIRLPRLVTAIIVGAGLSTAGAALQGLFRNPLADPYVLGFASGGAFGAALAMLLAGPILLGPSLGAFIGSSVAGLLVLMMSKHRLQNQLNTILLAGIAVGLVFSALLSMVLLFAQRQAGELISWLLGNVGQTTWVQISVIALLSLVGFVMIWSHSRALDLISLGLPTARGLDRLTRLRNNLLGTFCSSLVLWHTMVIGLSSCMPRDAAINGPRDSSSLYCLGATLLVAADLTSRWIMPARELPVEIVTALIGGPFFLYLLRRVNCIKSATQDRTLYHAAARVRRRTRRWLPFWSKRCRKNNTSQGDHRRLQASHYPPMRPTRDSTTPSTAYERC